MDKEQLETMRLGICAANGIKYYGSYNEEQAASFMGKDPSTLKRWRKDKKIFPVVEPGGKGIRYLGFQIADMIMGRAQPWDATQSEPSSLATGTSGSAAAHPLGTAAGTQPDGSSVTRSAQRILNRRSKS